MRLRTTMGTLVLLASFAAATPVAAQGLNDVLGRLLSDGCTGLGNRAFGPELARICASSGGGGGGGGVDADALPGGGTAGPASSAGGGGGATRGEDQRQMLRRLRQRQADARAEAEAARGFSFFGSTDYENYHEDTTRFETGFDRETAGGTAGLDYLFRDSLVLGAAFTYAHEFGDYEGVGGGFDHDAYGLLLYGSIVPLDRLFVDVVAGYTRKDYSFDRRASLSIPATAFTVGGTASGETTGNEFRVGLGTGYDFVLGHVTLGPRVGVLYRETTIDGFRESGQTGLELAYDDQNIRSLITTVGLYGSVTLSTGIGVIVPQATAEYVHEFLDDQRSVGFNLVQDPGQARFLFQTDPPDRDYVNVGLGVSMVLPSGVQPFINCVALLGYTDRTSQTFTVGVRIPF